MLLNEIITQTMLRQYAAKAPENETKRVQPVKRIAKTENEPDVKKKPVPKGRIDTYA